MESSRMNHKYEAVLNRTSSLVRLVRHRITSFTEECLSRRLITEDVEEFTWGNHTDSEKAAKLFHCIRDVISSDPSCFDTLIDVLKNRGLEGEARYLKDEYKTLSAHACEGDDFPPRLTSSSPENDSMEHRQAFCSNAEVMEDCQFIKIAKEIGIAKITVLFFKLKEDIAEKLDRVVTDMRAFRKFVLEIFEAGDSIPKSGNVNEIFTVLTEKKYWIFCTTTVYLEEIVIEFGGKLKDDCLELIDLYEKKLNGYEIGIMVAKFSNEINIIETGIAIDMETDECARHMIVDRVKCDERYCNKLSTTLARRSQTNTGIKISLESLFYVENYWHSLRKKFTLKSLSRVLDDIVEGSIIIHWMINAAQRPNLPLLKKSLDMGVDVNAKEKDEYGWTALMWACEKSHIDVVDSLLECGAHVDAVDRDEWTGLILSSRRGNLEIVRKLLHSGANVNKLTNMLWSALMWTAQEGCAEVARLLLDRGANAIPRDKAGFTPLLQASQDGHLGVVKVLVEHNPGMDMNQSTNNEWTPVMVATKNGHQDVVNYLADHNSDVFFKREDGVTALHIASYKGQSRIVRDLCVNKDRKKVNTFVNLQDEDGLNSLMYAAKQGHLDVVRTLVENGLADVNLTEKDNSWTALLFALQAGNHDVLNYLLRSRKVNILHKDDKGHTIVDIAKTINPGELVCLREYYTADTEAMIKRTPAKPVNMKDYKAMIDKIRNKISAQPGHEIAAIAA